MLYGRCETTMLNDFEALRTAIVEQLDRRNVFDIDAYGWLNEDEVDPGFPGYAMWTTSPPYDHDFEAWQRNTPPRQAPTAVEQRSMEIPAFSLKHWGQHHKIYRTEMWPPPTIKNNDPIILGGYPVNRRSQPEGDRPTTMSIDFVSFITRADNWSENHMAFCFDSTSWYWPQGEGLPPNPELSGASGGPCFLMVPDEQRIELAGFIYEAHTEYEVIRVRQANLINADGTITPAPIDPRRRQDEHQTE